ncbi:MAG: DUF1566 domain-containing protein [Desulfuromonadales bacterium]|nr:DUF1566 domain-containing protein [Desulfuromonadales bacterium]
MKIVFSLRVAAICLLLFFLPALNLGAELCADRELKPGLWQLTDNEDYFANDQFVVEPDGRIFWVSKTNIPVDVNCINPGGSFALGPSIEGVINDDDLLCSKGLAVDYRKQHSTWGGAETWVIKGTSTVYSETQMLFRLQAAIYKAVVDLDGTGDTLCYGIIEENLPANFISEIPAPETPASPLYYPEVFEFGQSPRISWHTVDNPAEITYILQRDSSLEFEHPVTVFAGQGYGIWDENLANEATEKTYYRVKATSAFGESEWLVGEHPITPPVEVTELQNDEPCSFALIPFNTIRYFKLEVPAGAEYLNIEVPPNSNCADCGCWTIYARHELIPTTSVYDGRGGRYTNKAYSPFCLELNGRSGTWYIGLRPDGCSSPSTITASYTDDCRLPYAPYYIDAYKDHTVNPDELDGPVYTFLGSGWVYLKWKEVLNAERYLVQKSPTADFTNPTTVYEGANTNTENFRPFTNSEADSYFFRVKAINQWGESPWCATKRFRPFDKLELLPIDLIGPVIELKEGVASQNLDPDDYHHLGIMMFLQVPEGTDEITIESTRDVTISSDIELYLRYQDRPVRYSDFNNAICDYSIRIDYRHQTRSITVPANGRYGLWFLGVAGDSQTNLLATLSGNCLAPIRPDNLDYPSLDNDGDFTINWEAVANATSYTLERAGEEDFSDAVVAYSGTATYFRERGLEFGSYFYRVRADNHCGQGLWRTGKPVCVPQPIYSPASITYSELNDDGVVPLSWAEAAEANYYMLERSTGAAFLDAEVIYYGPNRIFQDSTVTDGNYFYRVRAHYANGEISAWKSGSQVSVCIVPDPPEIIDYPDYVDKGFTIHWSEVSNAEGYILQRSEDSAFAALTELYSGAETGYTELTPENGSYYYRVRATNTCGGGNWCSGGRVVVENPPPAADFSADQTSGDVPLKVVFSNQSDGIVESWSWNFGDGQTSEETSPTHTYEIGGNFSVSLTVTGPYGQHTETKDNYIQAIQEVPVPGTLQFSSANWEASEGDGNVTINVCRLGGSDGAGAVDYELDSGSTATSDADFAFSPGTLSWADGDSSDKSFTITIIDDFDYEKPETVNLTLKNVSGAALGQTFRTTLTIISDDDFSYEHLPQPTGRIPDTGQITSTCENCGEDADYLINLPSYTKLNATGNDLPDDTDEWSTVRDNITGLIWEIKTDDDSIHDKDNKYTWDNCENLVAALNAANYGGHNDWRLPTIFELLYLNDYGQFNPSIQTDYFPQCQSDAFWSSTVDASSSNFQWTFNFSNGCISSSLKSNSSCYVRAVCSGLSRSSSPVDNGNGTVTDPHTGLMWQQGETDSMTRDAALQACENSNLAGYDDWRLPNVKELASLVDFNRFNPSADDTSFPDIFSNNYWSSSIQSSDPNKAWLMNFFLGMTVRDDKLEKNNVRVVRGGQTWSNERLYIATPEQASCWESGKVMEILWETRDLGGEVRISLSRDGGKSYSEIVANTPNDGSYNWVVTAPASVNCALKIEPLNAPGQATVQSLFTIEVLANQGPSAPTLIYPADGNLEIAIETDLSWTGAEDPDPGDTITYNVFFGLDNPPTTLVSNDQPGLSYDPGTLEYSTTYYWKVVAKDNHGAEIEGPVWSFSTTDDHSLVNQYQSQPTGRIPDTGQTSSYTSTFGEDADYLINPPSYTRLNANGSEWGEGDPQWAMVRDNISGLIWEVKTNDDSIHDKDNNYTWYDSNDATNGGEPGTPGEGTDTEDFIKSLNENNFGGYDDWRLPTFKELLRFCDLGRNHPAIATNFFPYCQSQNYWTATTHAGFTDNAWIVCFSQGDTDYGRKRLAFPVRAVRSGQTRSIESLLSNGDGSVTDPNTGLMWQQAESASMVWDEALSSCESMELAGYNDWRLPNRNELQSLVDYSESDPCIEDNLFPDVSLSPYWTSTSSVLSPDEANLVSFRKGDVYAYAKTNSSSVRAVRGGQPWAIENLFIAVPAQASFWEPGDNMAITWETRELAGDVKISLSIDGGKTYSEIDAATPNDGLYEWTVTGPDSVNCTLKIEPLSNPDATTVQGLFSIKAMVDPEPEDLTWYRDLDGDGFGDPQDYVLAPEEPDGYVANKDDADDNDNSTYPGAPELCDGNDNDQDGEIDEGCSQGFVFVCGDGECGGNWPCYESIEGACFASENNDVIKVCAGFYFGNLILGDNLVFTLSGGWNSDYSDNSAGQSTVDGSLTITGGTVIVEGIVIEGATSLSKLEVPKFGSWLPGYWSRWASLR